MAGQANGSDRLTFGAEASPREMWPHLLRTVLGLFHGIASLLDFRQRNKRFFCHAVVARRTKAAVVEMDFMRASSFGDSTTGLRSRSASAASGRASHASDQD